MATIYQLKTFQDIYNAVLEELSIQPEDTVALNRIKRDINTVYLEEVCPESRWAWLRKQIDLEHPAYISNGTAAFVANSETVTLTTAPSYSVAGYYIINTAYNEVYRIRSHTAASTTLTLETKYTGTSSATATYRIWSKTLALPPNCRETIEVRQDFMNKPLEARGFQDLQKIESLSPRAQGRAQYYSTGDYVDPSPYSSITSLPATLTRSSSGLVRTVVFASSLDATSGDNSTRYIDVGNRIKITGAGSALYNGEWIVSDVTTTTLTDDTITFTASVRLYEASTSDTGITVTKRNTEGQPERYRELWIYPSAYDAKSTLHVSYILDPEPLVNNTDEPLMPIGDRSVLVFGAAAKAWARVRKNDDYVRNKNEFMAKLTKMKGKTEDSVEFAKIIPSKEYLSFKRRLRSGVISQTSIDNFASGGGSSAATVTGTAYRVAVYNSVGEIASNQALTSTGVLYADSDGYPKTDSTAFAYDATNDRLALGVDASVTSVTIGGSSVGSTISTHTEATSANLSNVSTSHNPTAALGTRWAGARSRGTLASPSVIQSGDAILIIDGLGFDGTDYGVAARIKIESDGTPGAADMPGRIVFMTSPDGSETLAACVTIASDRGVTLTGALTLAGYTISHGVGEYTTVTSVTLNDNQAAADNIFTFSASAYTANIIEYSISRGVGNRETGRIFVTTDGTSVAHSQDAAVLGTIGVTITSDISGGLVRIRYTSTSTGTAPTFTYLSRRW